MIMFPKASVSGGTLDALLLYLSILGILLAAGTAIRLKVPILRKYHIPASLIAGVLGLLLGPYFLKIIPKTVTQCYSALAGRLIVIIFTPMLMGEAAFKNSKLAKKTLGAICFSFGACAVQYAVPLLLSLLIFIPFFHVNPLFSVIVEEGWIGGHGTAGGMALVFEDLGWADGQSLAITSATVGLLYGVISGMVLINIAAARGWTRFLHSHAQLKEEKAELFPEGERKPGSYLTVDNGVIDSMAFHAAVLLIAVFIGWYLRFFIKAFLHISVSWFITAMFAGLIVKKILQMTSWRNSLDKGTMSRIQGFCLEFLVAGAVASVNISVIISYALPLLIQQCVIMAVMVFLALWYCRRLYGDYWFENSMICYGAYCGVFATGMLLLKTCDPDLKSDAMEIFALKAPFTSWAIGGGIITGMMPYWIAQYGTLNMFLVTGAAAVIALTLPRILGCWFPVKQETV